MILAIELFNTTAGPSALLLGCLLMSCHKPRKSVNIQYLVLQTQWGVDSKQARFFDTLLLEF